MSGSCPRPPDQDRGGTEEFLAQILVQFSDLNFLLKPGDNKKMWSMLEQECRQPGPGITKFQTSLYDPFHVVLFTKVLSLLKSLHNIPETWALGLLSLNIVYTRALVGQAEPINHQVWPLVFIVLEFLEDSLPINCIFVSLVDVGDPRGCAHDMVLNTGCCRIVIGVRIVHGHAETREQLHFLSNTEIYIHDLSKSLFTCYYFSVERVQFDVQSSEKWKI